MNEILGTKVSDIRTTNFGTATNTTITAECDFRKIICWHRLHFNSRSQFTRYHLEVSLYLHGSILISREIVKLYQKQAQEAPEDMLSLSGILVRYIVALTTELPMSIQLQVPVGLQHPLAEQMSLSRSGASCRIYINGVDRTTTDNNHTAISANSLPLVIGARADLSTEFWDGKVDDVYIYNQALSSTEINTLIGMIPTDLYLHNITNSTTSKMEGTGSLKIPTSNNAVDANTVALWHLDETGGTAAYLKDSSSYANHGTPTGTTIVNGITSKGRYLNGTSSDYIVVPDSAHSNSQTVLP